MAESMQVALITIVALFVGVLIPVLLSMRATFRRTEALIDNLEHRFATVLDQSHHILSNVDRISEDVLDTSAHLKSFSDTIHEFTSSIEHIRQYLYVAVAAAGAVSPAVHAAVRSFRGSVENQEPASEEMDETIVQ